MSDTVISRRYAKALLSLAAKAKRVEPVAAGLDALVVLVQSTPEFAIFIADPKVTHSAKETVLAEVAGKAGMDELLVTFLRLLARKRRAALLEEICTVYHELADEQLGRGHAEVTVAASLSQAQQDELRRRLEALSGKQLTLHVTTDPSILGGAVARIGSTVWDGSVRNQLTQIRQSIIKG